MVAMSQNEMLAVEVAGADAGTYLDGLDKTDLKELSPEEWTQFLVEVVLSFSKEMRRLESAASQRE